MRRVSTLTCQIAAVLASAGVASCESPPLAVDYWTEHLRIGTDLDYPLCQGDLDSYERTIATMEDELGVELRSTVDVYLWSHDSWSSQGVEGCSREVLGCYDYEDRAVHASTQSLEHELAHAVIDNPYLDVYFSEGIANMYAGDVTLFGVTGPSANIHANADNYDLEGATHFARWLRDRWGAYKLGELAKRHGSGFDNFEEVYGVSLSVAESLYFEDSPAIYPSIYSCDAPEIPTRDLPVGWAAEVDIDCGRGDTYGAPIGLYTHRTLVVREDGRYSFVTNGGLINAFRCAEGQVAEYPSQAELANEDIPPEYAGYPQSAYRYFAGHEVHTVELRRGRYNLAVGIEGFEPSTVTVAAWPALGSGPVEEGGA